MEQTTLKYLRILIPGMFSYLGFYPIFNFYFGEIYDVKSVDFAIVTVISILLGAIYYQINIQYFVIEFSRHRINKNIFDKLVKIYGKDLNESQKNFIETKYMHVFYKIIDSEESLKRKTNNVYFNGIFWTSSADLFLFSMFFGLIYWCFFERVNDSKLISFLFFLMAVLSFTLHFLSARKHIQLSNDQLGFIDVHNREKVKEYFDNILQQMPKSDNEEGQGNNKPRQKRISKK